MQAWCIRTPARAWNLTNNAILKKRKKKKEKKKIDTNTFKQDLSDIFSPNSSVSDYNNHLRSVLDKHAPLPSHIPYEEADTLAQHYRGAVLQAEKGASEGRETLAQV